MLNQSNIKPIVVASTDIDTVDATRELIEKSLARLDGLVPKAGLVYFGIETETDVLSSGLLQQWPELQLIGCSTWGEMSPEYGFTEDGIVLCLFCSDSITFSAMYLDTNQTLDSASLVKSFCHSLATQTGEHSQAPILSLILSDVLFFSELEPLLEELHRQMPTTHFFGGGAADSMDFKQTKILCGDRIMTTGCTFLCMYGDLKISTILDNGWEPIGKRGVVTRAEKNRIIEVDHKPALQFYSESFSKPLAPVIELPICVYDQNGDQLFIRASTGGHDSEPGSACFFGRVPEGSTIELATIAVDNIIKGVEKSVQASISDFGNNVPALAIFSSCASRRAVLGTRVSEELNSIKAIIPQETLYLGYYTFGEICAGKLGPPSVYHNQTFSTLLIG